MRQRGPRTALVLTAVLLAIGGIVGTPAVAQAAVFTEAPDVTCTSEEHPELAGRLADVVRAAVNTGSQVHNGFVDQPGVAFYDRVTGTECWSDESTGYQTASLVKAAIMAALLARPQALTDAERPQVEKMIIESDNETALALWRDSLGCGKDGDGDPDDNSNVRPCTAFRNFLEAAGTTGTYPDDGGAFGDTYTTARDQVTLFKLFAYPNDLIEDSRREYALDLLRRAERKYGVTSSAPPGTERAVKIGFSKLGGEDDEWHVTSTGHVSGGRAGYDYVLSLLSDDNAELPFTPLPLNGIERLDRIGEVVNCGIRELHGDGSCVDYQDDSCDIFSTQLTCETDRPVWAHRTENWVRVDLSAKLGSTVHWELVDAANGTVVDAGDAVGGEGCECERTVRGLHGLYVLRLRTDQGLGGDDGTLLNYTGEKPGGSTDQPPVVGAGPDLRGDEGAPISIAGFASDDGGTPGVRWSSEPVSGVDTGGACTFAEPTSLRTTVTCNDDGTFRLTLTANDGVNGAVSDSAQVVTANVAPSVGGTTGQRAPLGVAAAGAAPAVAAAAGQPASPVDWQLFRAGESVTVRAPITDPGTNDTHTCRIRWDDGTSEDVTATGSAGCVATHTYRHAGMFTIDLAVTDDDAGQGTGDVMVVVYDPDAGWANTDGSIASPSGSLVGTGSREDVWFHLRAQYYHSDDTRPVATAKTWVAGSDAAYRFDAGDRGVDWLVVTPDGKVAAKGTGTLQGRSGRYGFVFYGCTTRATSGCPGGADAFRTVVWDLAAGPNPGAGTVYDNRPSAGFDLDLSEPQRLRTGIVSIHPPH
ncbi:PKD domain-containing protein [Cellulomonas sp. NS3]|uniref:PKD domain-containing protein n=1 Tax=Cellulomonas sp. NS3 TaxID=2973977 RepID=UPI002161E0F8|nr:PKD domain-containing protein [Cellulomonas sp. NS3]